MKILRNSEETNSMELTSSPEVSHVRTSQSPEKEQASKKEQGPVFGLNSCGLLAIYDPDLHSLRTCQCSLFGAEQESLKILPKSGMTQNGRLLGQTMWVQDIGERGSGLFRTPNTFDGMEFKSQKALDHEYTHRQGRAEPNNLRDQIAVREGMRTWPTPTKLEIDASNSRTVIGNREIDKKGRTWGASLTTVVQTQEKLKNKPQETFPTPRAREIDEKVETWQKRMDKRVEEGKPPVSKNLSMTVKNFPTPTKHDAKTTKPRQDTGNSNYHTASLATVVVENFPTPSANEDAAGTPQGKMQKVLGNCKEVRDTGTGTLNPNWVEWLMGYPVGWTDLKDSETP